MWQPAPRTEEAKKIYAAAEADRQCRPENYQLAPEAVIEKALGGVASSGFSETLWREGLTVYLNSAREDGRLNALGIRTMTATAIARLRAGRAISEYMESHPGIGGQKIFRPIFIIGGWRTGTTLLQRMLASVPLLRGAYPWELSAPWRAAAADAGQSAKLREDAQQAHDFLHLLNPTMKIVHLSGPDLPEECVLAMGTDFRNWGFTSTLCCPKYVQWLKHQDFGISYRRYADILRILQNDSGRRWILKAPAHTAELFSLLAAFPDACILHLHRDVVETVASGASLFAVFRSTYSDQVDPSEVGRFQLDQTRLWLDRAMRCREKPPEDSHPTFMDLAYKELIHDPAGAAKKIFKAFDLEWSATVSDGIEEYLATHPHNAYGRHRYTAEQFGLEPDEIRKQLLHYSRWAGLA
jgi:hypothetical protein